jgi:hypothetical protein
MNIDRFKTDHNTIMASIKELRELVADDISANADAIATTLINMSAKIKLHLSTEDMVLYPVLFVGSHVIMYPSAAGLCCKRAA